MEKDCNTSIQHRTPSNREEWTTDLCNNMNKSQIHYAKLVFWWMFETRYFFVVGGCPVHRRIFNSIPGLFPLDPHSTPRVLPVLTTKYVSKSVRCPLWGPRVPSMNNDCAKQKKPNQKVACCMSPFVWHLAKGKKL